MLTFKINAKKYSPEVFTDRENHVIDVSGTSTFKNTSWFYSNVLKWVIAFNNNKDKPTIINIKLNKIDDNSSKWILLIVQKLSALVTNQRITVNWYYAVKNASILISGERLKLNSEIPVNLIAA